MITRYLRPGFILLLVLLSGCNTNPPPQQPFTKFNESLATLSSGSDDALKGLIDHSRASFLAQAGTLKAETVGKMGLAPDPNDPFLVKPDTTIIYLQLIRLRVGMSSLNTALQGYSARLIELASPDLVSDKQIDDWARDLNQNIRSAAVAFGANDAAANQSALISTVASDAFKAYLRTKQRSELANALTKNQPQIEAAAKQCQAGMKISALALRKAYNDEFGALIRAVDWQHVKPDEQATLVQKILDLNAEYQTRLSIFRELAQTYGGLPAAHAELVQALQNPSMDLGAVIQLTERGLRLRQLYEELRAVPVPTTSPSH